MASHITLEDFKKKVYDIDNIESADDLKLIGNNPVVIDFYAPWCGPCKILEPIFDELSERYEGHVDFYKVNIDDELDLAVAFGVRSVPMVLYIPTKGKPSLEAGAPSQEQLKYYVDGLIEKSKEEV